LFHIVVDADPNLVFIADASGRIVRVNARWIDYTGVTIDQISLERGAPLDIVHPDDLEVTWSHWKHSLATGDVYEVTYRLRSASEGKYRWFLVRAMPYVENGKRIGWYGVATDVHDQVRSLESSRFLSAAATALTSSFDWHKILAAFMQVVKDRFCDGCIVTLLDDKRELHRAALVHRDPEIEAKAREKSRNKPVTATSAVTRVFATKQSVFIPDVDRPDRREWRNAEGVEISRIFEPTRSVLSVPLLIADRVRGTLSFAMSRPGVLFDETHLEAAEAVARQAATAFEHASAFAREREATERFRYLAHATDQLFEPGDLRTNLDTLVKSLVGYWADWSILYRIEDDGAVRVRSVSYCDPSTAFIEDLRGQRLFHPQAERQFRDIVSKRRSRMRTDVTAESTTEVLQPFLRPVLERMHVQSLLLIPLYTTEFDFGAIGVYMGRRNYDESDRELFEELGRRISLAIAHEHSLGRERRLTRTLQEVALPAQLPTIPGIVLSSEYATATTSEAPVGGDWYDAFSLPSGQVVFSIGDVTGSGLQASAIMGKLRQTINSIAMFEKDPARILDAMEYVVLQRYPDAIATAFIGIYDPVAKTLKYANAGHNSPLVRFRDGTVESLVAHGLPVGLRKLAEPSESRGRSLTDAALMVFYTDGITEASHNIDEGERLLYAVVANDAMLYVRNAATLVAASCLSEGPRVDDAAILVVTFPRGTAWQFDADNAKSAQLARGEFFARLQEEAAPESDFGAAELIFGELVGNVVRHAPGAIDVTLEWEGSRALLHVIDRGHGFEYVPPVEIDLLREEGRGLWLIHQFAAFTSIEYLPGYGTHVTVELPVRRVAVQGVTMKTVPAI
ncbi:MAG: SpoIIE family protein phosphatase, partial [Vulcanimicrobiaceae bacterium]